MTTTELAMLVLEACMGTVGTVEPAVLYDLAADWIEHRGWAELRASVPEFGEFACANAATLTALECTCAEICAAVAGVRRFENWMGRCLEGVRCATRCVAEGRQRHMRQQTFPYKQLGPPVPVATQFLVAGCRFGSAHAFALYARAEPTAQCLLLPVRALDHLLTYMIAGGGARGRRCCIAVTSDHVLLCVPGDIAATALPPVHPLIAERGAIAACQVDTIIAGFLDPEVGAPECVEAATALRRLYVCTKKTIAAASPGETAAAMRAKVRAYYPDQMVCPDRYVDTIVADQTDVVTAPTDAELAAHYRTLPATLDVLYSRKVAAADDGIISALARIWDMPPAAFEIGGGGGGDGAALAGIRMEPQYSTGPCTYERSIVYELVPSDGESSTTHCHGTALQGILAFLMPERRHHLDAPLVPLLEELLISAMPTDMPADPEQLAGVAPYGHLAVTVLLYRGSPAGRADAPLVLRCGQVLNEYYALLRDPAAGSPAQRRALFCSVTVVMNELSGTYCAAFPIPGVRAIGHSGCTEHQPKSPALPATADADCLVQYDAECDTTAVVRAVVDLTFDGANLPLNRLAATPDKPEDCAVRFGAGAVMRLSTPAARPGKARREPEVAPPPKKAPKGKDTTVADDRAGGVAERPTRRPAKIGDADEIYGDLRTALETKTMFYCPFLPESCNRVLAYFIPDARRSAIFGGPCVSTAWFGSSAPSDTGASPV
ncbi:MAG: hypothetical protein M0R22_13840, partial [Dehalococcoidia bacterium]|nr:hypothetical protein [Dehalococcoidia bacterium]